LCIAIYALCLPTLFKFIEQWLPVFAANADINSWFILQGVTLLLMMLLPAIAMGFIFPLVLRSLDHLAGTLPLLYGVNAGGGALGALLPLYLLPAFGWTSAIQLLASAGCVVTIIILWLSRQSTGDGNNAQSVSSENRNQARIPLMALVCYAGIGAASLMLEIGWTRLFGMVMLRTEYVLAIILAVFLVGIGGGSLIGRFLTHGRWLIIMPCVAVFGAIASMWCLPLVSAWVEQAQFDSLLQSLMLQGAVLSILTLPVTLVLGAWLPVLAVHGSYRSHGSAVSGARFYGANSVGAAVGALIAGFVLIPQFGTLQTMIMACLLLLFCGFYFAPQRMWALYITPLLLLMAWPVHNFPPVARLLPKAHANNTDLYRYEDAVSITHVIEREDGQRLLLSDMQRMDASTDPAAMVLQQNQARLPLLLHGNPASILFLGLGTGITASGSIPFGKIDRTAVELSKGAITAASNWFDIVNGHITGSMRVINHDGRHFLRTSQQQFDVIIGDVFHPDMAGRSALLSVQQFERARSRLSEQGLFVQWLALNQFDVHALTIVLRSFQHVFPGMMIFVDGFRLAMVGFNSDELTAYNISSRMVKLLGSLDTANSHAASGGEGQWSWLGRYWGQPHLPAGVLQHEWSPQIDFSLPQSRYRGDIDIVRVLDWLLSQRPTPQQAAMELGVDDISFREFERAYMGTTLALLSWQAGLQGHQADADRFIRFANKANPNDRWVAMTLADDMLATLPEALARGMSKDQALLSILAIQPDHVETLRELLQMTRAQGDVKRAAQYLMQLRQLVPLDRELQEIQL